MISTPLVLPETGILSGLREMLIASPTIKTRNPSRFRFTIEMSVSDNCPSGAMVQFAFRAFRQHVREKKQETRQLEDFLENRIRREVGQFQRVIDPLSRQEGANAVTDAAGFMPLGRRQSRHCLKYPVEKVCNSQNEICLRDVFPNNTPACNPLKTQCLQG